MITNLEHAFKKSAQPSIAVQQAAYMKNNFRFFGLPKPLRAEIQKAIFKEHPITSADELRTIILTLWNKPEREFQYAALDVAIKYKKLWTPDFLKTFETMIRTNSWWDSVDTLAANMVGILIKNNPGLLAVMDTWSVDECLWIRRSALLFQLRWKQDTNEKILYAYCSALSHEKDFFIRKAIGWALREYSKTDKNSVNQFVKKNMHRMSPLSIREASKYL